MFNLWDLVLRHKQQLSEMGFITNLLSAAVKVTVSPIALVADVGTKVLTGEDLGATKATIGSALDDVAEAPEKLFEDGDVL